jgi:proteasome lid subunit RPN8/RPN11
VFYTKEKRRERELYAKEKESMVERRESNVEEGKERKGIFVHSHPNCPKSLSFENLSQNSFKPLFGNFPNK